MNSRTRGRLVVALKALVTLSLLGLSLHMIEVGTLVDRLRGADMVLLAVAAAILVVGGFAGSASWFFILRTRLPGISYREVAARHWSGMFFNSFLPSNVGGDVVKGYIVARDQGQAGFVVTSLLLDRAVNLGMLLGIGILALLFQMGHPFWAAALLGAMAVSLLGMLASARWLRRWFRERRHRWAAPGIKGRIAGLAEPIFDLLATPRLLAPTLLSALASQMLKTWMNAFVILALGLEIPTRCVWYVIPVFGVVSALPVSIGGLGLREMVAQSLSMPMQVENTHLVALSLAGHLVVVLVNMLGVVPFLFAKRRG